MLLLLVIFVAVMKSRDFQQGLFGLRFYHGREARPQTAGTVLEQEAEN